jgi:hypothetical protein
MFRAKYLNQETGETYYRMVREQWLADKYTKRGFICVKVISIHY